MQTFPAHSRDCVPCTLTRLRALCTPLTLFAFTLQSSPAPRRPHGNAARDQHVRDRAGTLAAL